MSAAGLPAPLIGAAELAERREETVVADVRWYLDGRSGAEAFRGGHLPGAVFCDLDAALAGPGPPRAGRHPLPSPERFAEAMGAIGIAEGTPVVAYDDAGGASAARLVVLLRALGEPAALLDGGLSAWDGPLERGESMPVPVRRAARPWPARLLGELDALDALGPEDVLIDARAPERYRGELEPVDPRAGHIPGAWNLPLGELLGPDARFLPPPELARRFLAAGVTDAAHLVASCGSGVTACALLLAAEAAGLGEGRLYVPSFSGWSREPSRPVATGPLPGGGPGDAGSTR